MKLVFVYRNGSRFVASNVTPESIDATGQRKLEFIRYSVCKEVNADVLASRLALFFPQAPEDGIFCEVMPEQWSTLVSANYIVDVNRSQLSYVIQVNQEDDDATNPIEAYYRKSYLVIPVLDNPTLDALTDGLKVMM